MYRIAFENNDCMALKVLFENDYNTKINLFRKIIKYNLFENSVKSNDYNFVKKVLDYKDFSFKCLKYEKFLIKPLITTKILFPTLLKKNIPKLLIKSLIKPPFSDFKYKNLILNMVIKMGDLNLVKYLIENEDFKYTAEGINTKDLKEKYPIIEALSTKNIEIFDYLLEKGANYNTISRNGVPLIFLAIYNNNVDFIYSLINDETCDKININGYDRNEYTPLIASYVNDSTDIFNYLLEYSDINKKDRNGHNILYYAIEKNDRTNVENFINIGIELNNDAINIAIDEYDEYIIKYLLDFIPYSYHNDIGEPLLTAIINHKSNLCKYEYIEILLKNGYNKNIKDWNGRTPLWHAEQKYDDYKKRNLNYNIYCNINNNTYYKIIQLLKKYGAK